MHCLMQRMSSGMLPLATRQGRSGDAAASFSSSGSDMGSALREGERERGRERAAVSDTYNSPMTAYWGRRGGNFAI